MIITQGGQGKIQVLWSLKLTEFGAPSLKNKNYKVLKTKLGIMWKFRRRNHNMLWKLYSCLKFILARCQKYFKECGPEDTLERGVRVKWETGHNKLQLKYLLLQILQKHRACEHTARVSEGACTCGRSSSQSFLSFTVNQFLRWCLLKIFLNCKAQYRWKALFPFFHFQSCCLLWSLFNRLLL